MTRITGIANHRGVCATTVVAGIDSAIIVVVAFRFSYTTAVFTLVVFGTSVSVVARSIVGFIGITTFTTFRTASIASARVVVIAQRSMCAHACGAVAGIDGTFFTIVTLELFVGANTITTSSFVAQVDVTLLSFVARCINAFAAITFRSTARYVGTVDRTAGDVFVSFRTSGPMFFFHLGLLSFLVLASSRQRCFDVKV